MKYNIEIMGKDECTMFSKETLDKDYIIISINDTGYYTTVYSNPKIKGINALWFDDITLKAHERDNVKLMLPSQAEKIKNFIDKYKGYVTNIVVHCTAGISRSGAVGCVIARYLNGDDEYLLKTGRYIPNKHVYKLMCEAFNLEYSDELFEKKLNVKYSKPNSNDLNLDDLFKRFN